MTRRNEIVVGIVVIFGVLLVIFGTIWLKGLKLGSEEVTVQARFREVGQLLVGSTVKYRGVAIGRVEQVQLEPGGAAVIVTMTVDGSVNMPDDPGVVLAPESMFGDWQAEVVPRTAFRTYDFTESLDPKVWPGYSLPDMSRLTAVADEIATNLATISSRVELAFTEETALNVREAIENIQEASAQLASLVSTQQVAIDEVAQNLEQTSEAAGQAALTMQRAFSEIERAIGDGNLVSIFENVESASARTDSLMSLLVTASNDMRATASAADSTFRKLNAIASSIEQGEGSLGMLLQDTALYVNLVETNIEVQALLRDIRQNPRKYINLSVFGR